jgi:hypothetical protein
MEAAAIRDAIRATPFRPFRLRLADGRALHVPHPDYISLAPNGRQLVVYSLESRMSILEPLLIVSLERDVPEQQSGPGEAGSSNGNGQDAPA